MNWKFRLFHTGLKSMLLSLMMTFWVSWINLGWISDFISRWMQAWLLAWPAALVCVLLLARPVMWLSQSLWRIKS